MKRVICLMSALILLSGCITPKAIRLTDLPATENRNVIDATRPDDYPSPMVGELNIYSCRYGIHHYTRSEFEPAKRDAFARLLLELRPQLAAVPVRLDRFDLYRNLRLRALSFAGSHMGGGVAAAIASSADRTSLAASGVAGFSIERDPRVKGHAENQIGCDNQGEGEYVNATVPPGHDVMVLWLDFSVGASRHHYRSQYAFQFDDAGSFSRAAVLLVALTMETAALGVELSDRSGVDATAIE